MTESKAARFLKRNRPAIVNGVADVDTLVDFLIKKDLISNETISEINMDIPIHNKVRKILDLFYRKPSHQCEELVEWLKENWSHLEWENDSDPEQDAPLNKRPRRSVPDVDEADSSSNEPNLKTMSSLGKLEKWVSENSQSLIDQMRNKVDDGEMEALLSQLKDKKLKKCLCFTVKNVKAIGSNQKLRSFFRSQEGKFPDLAVKLFFEKDLDFSKSRVKRVQEQSGNVQNPEGEDHASLEGTSADMQEDSGSASCEPPEAESGNVDLATRGNLKREDRPRRAPDELGKKRERYNLLREWVKERCSSEEDVKKMLKCIWIENQVEHREYPCFIAEHVMMYKDPNGGEALIVVTDVKNAAARTNLPEEMTFLLNYQMWVCGVQKALLISPGKREMKCAESFEATISQCERFVLEVFAPTLAVFKNMQRERLNSAIQN